MKLITLALANVIFLGIHTTYANDLANSKSLPSKGKVSVSEIKECVSDAENVCIKTTTGGGNVGVDWTTKGPEYKEEKDNKVMGVKKMEIDMNQKNLNNIQGGQ